MKKNLLTITLCMLLGACSSMKRGPSSVSDLQEVGSEKYLLAKELIKVSKFDKILKNYHGLFIISWEKYAELFGASDYTQSVRFFLRNFKPSQLLTDFETRLSSQMNNEEMMEMIKLYRKPEVQNLLDKWLTRPDRRKLEEFKQFMSMYDPELMKTKYYIALTQLGALDDSMNVGEKFLTITLSDFNSNSPRYKHIEANKHVLGWGIRHGRRLRTIELGIFSFLVKDIGHAEFQKIVKAFTGKTFKKFRGIYNDSWKGVVRKNYNQVF